MPLDELFAAALECGNAAERATLLNRACADNLPLRAEVESLLSAHDVAERFLEATRESIRTARSR